MYFTPFQSIKYSNICSKIYIYHYLVTIDSILHHISICIRYIFSWNYLFVAIFCLEKNHHPCVMFIWSGRFWWQVPSNTIAPIPSHSTPWRCWWIDFLCQREDRRGPLALCPVSTALVYSPQLLYLHACCVQPFIWLLLLRFINLRSVALRYLAFVSSYSASNIYCVYD